MPYSKTADLFANEKATSLSPARKVSAIVPNDTTDLAQYAKDVFITTGGTIKVIPVENADNAPVTLTMADKSRLGVQVRRVFATGTSATGLFGFFN